MFTTTFIDRPGQYITRNGNPVRIDVIVSGPDATTFSCKGHWYKTTRHGKVQQKFDIWQSNGCYRAVAGSGLDIVGYCGS